MNLVQVDDHQRQEVMKAAAKAAESTALDYSVDVVFDAGASELTRWMLANTPVLHRLHAATWWPGAARSSHSRVVFVARTLGARNAYDLLGLLAF